MEYSPDDIEKGIIGQFLFDRKTFFDNCQDLKIEHFANPSAQAMINAMVQSNAKTTTEFKNEIIANQTEQGLALSAYMLSIISKPMTGRNLKDYMTALVNNAQLRLISYAGRNILTLVDNRDAGGAMTAVSALKMKIEENTRVSEFDLKECVRDMIATQMDVMTGGASVGLSTGFENLGHYFTMKKTELITVSARASIGKTSFVLCVANERLKQGDHGLIVSAEMSAESLITRMTFLNAGIDLNVFNPNDGRDATASDIELFQSSAKNISDYDLQVWDESRPNIDQIIMGAKSLNNKKKLDWIMIDYAQILTTTKDLSPVERISEITSKCKALARDLKIPVLLLAQLNRDAEGKEPTLADLKGSSSLEDDSDIVMFLHRDRKDLLVENPPDEVITKAIIAKNRSGKIGATNLKFRPAQTLFTDASRMDISNLENNSKGEKAWSAEW